MKKMSWTYGIMMVPGSRLTNLTVQANIYIRLACPQSMSLLVLIVSRTSSYTVLTPFSYMMLNYRKLLLVNHESEVLNLWLINNFVPELSAGRNNEIIDIYKIQEVS